MFALTLFIFTVESVITPKPLTAQSLATNLTPDDKPIQICILRSKAADLTRIVIHDNLDLDKTLEGDDLSNSIDLQQPNAGGHTRFSFCSYKTSEVFKTSKNTRPIILKAGNKQSSLLYVGTNQVANCHYSYDLKDIKLDGSFSNDSADETLLVNGFLAPLFNSAPSKVCAKTAGNEANPTQFALTLIPRPAQEEALATKIEDPVENDEQTIIEDGETVERLI